MEPKPRLTQINLEMICKHLESIYDSIYKSYHELSPVWIKLEIEAFVKEEELTFSHNFDPTIENIKPNAYEWAFVAHLKENLQSFRNYLEKKMIEIQKTIINWQKFSALNTRDSNPKEAKIHWIDTVIDRIKHNPQITNSTPNFTSEEIIRQLNNIKHYLEKSQLEIDFSKLPPKDFKCFSLWLYKLLSYNSNNKQHEEAINRVYNNTNISINANIVMNPQLRPQVLPVPSTYKQRKISVGEVFKDPTKVIKRQENIGLDENLWEKMENLAENPFLNDWVIKETVKQKKIEKRKSEIPLKEAENLVKKLKKEDFNKNCVIINKSSNGVNGVIEMFKEILSRYEEGFRNSLLSNLEKFRLMGYKFKIKPALMENGLSVKLSNEAKLEYDFLKILIYPNTIMINDCKALRELEICLESSQNEDLGFILRKWEQFSGLMIKK